MLARQKRRALVILITNLRDEDDEQLLAAVKCLNLHHRVLLASLQENVLDEIRHHPVQNQDEALTYCGAVDYLNASAQCHERLSAHGIAMLNVRPGELGSELVTRYLSWKKAGAF